MQAADNIVNASQGKELNQFIQAGFDLLKKEHSHTQAKAACDQWLTAWELVKQMATPLDHRGRLRPYDCSEYCSDHLLRWSGVGE